MISFISLFQITNVVIPHPKVFFWISTSVTDDASAVDPNSIKTLWTNSLSSFFIKGKPVLKNGPRSLPRNHPDYTILDSWVFNNFILGNELFAKGLWNLSISDNLYEKLVSSLESPITFDDSFSSTLLPMLFYWVVN